MSSYNIKHSYKQIYMVQMMMKLFIDKGWGTFESFLEIWKDRKMSNIHYYVSFRHLIFGYCQTTISTFIGYCHPKKRSIEKKGGLFGLYLTYSTQFSQVPSPIQLSTSEFNWLKEIAKEFPECNQIFSSLVKRNAFCFVPNENAILTKFSEVPSSVMINEFLPLNDAFKRLENIKDENENYEEESNENFEELKDNYEQLIEELRS